MRIHIIITVDHPNGFVLILGPKNVSDASMLLCIHDELKIQSPLFCLYKLHPDFDALLSTDLIPFLQ